MQFDQTLQEQINLLAEWNKAKISDIEIIEQVRKNIETMYKAIDLIYQERGCR